MITFFKLGVRFLLAMAAVAAVAATTARVAAADTGPLDAYEGPMTVTAYQVVATVYATGARVPGAIFTHAMPAAELARAMRGSACCIYNVETIKVPANFTDWDPLYGSTQAETIDPAPAEH